MAACEPHRLRMLLYLDDELDADEQRLVQAHLTRCTACRSAFSRERLFREGVRRRRPLHVAPDGLRTRVASFVDTRRMMSLCTASPHRPRRLTSVAARRLRRYSVAALVAGLVGFIGIQNGLDVIVATAEASGFPRMAVDVHKRHRRGHLPLEVNTDASGDISRWFEGKVPFSVMLPDYQETSGQDNRYEIKGARLVGFNGDYAAYVAYEMDQQPVGLVITSTSTAEPAGGEIISSKGTMFHFEIIDGLKVITWSHRNLTYALVSNLEERGQKSCMVCHQGAKDRDFIESLAFMDGAPDAVAGRRQFVR